jgi:hypothetical protein
MDEKPGDFANTHIQIERDSRLVLYNIGSRSDAA